MKEIDRLADAIDEDTRAVRWSDDHRHLVVWSGGVTFNIYHVIRDPLRIRPVTSFELSDRKGRPVDRDRATDKMDEMLSEYRREDPR